MERGAVIRCALVLFGSGAVMMKAWGPIALSGPASLLITAAIWAWRSRQGARGPWAGGRGNPWRPGPKSLMLWAVVFLAGMVSMAIASWEREPDRRLRDLGRAARATVVGVIEGVPDESPDGRWRGVVRVQSANGHPGAAGARVLLVVDCNEDLRAQLLPGAVVEASGRFYAPQPPANPGERDIRIALACKGVSGTLYVVGSGGVALRPGRRFGVAALAADLRRRMMAVTRATLPPAQADLLSGMLFGIAPEGVEVEAQVTGTAHLFCVSGLHIGLVAAVLWGVLATLGLHGPVALIWAAGGGWLYAVACGMRPSAIRAALMLSCAGASALTKRRASVRAALYLTALVMLARNPFLIFDPGAQMSFASVLGILQLSSRFRRNLAGLPGWLADSLAASLAAQAGVAPLVAWYFGRVSPIGILANVPCVALAGVAVVAGFVAALVGIVWLPAAVVLNAGNTVVLLALERSIEALGRVPFASLPVARPPLWAVVCVYLSMLVVDGPRRLRRAVASNRRRLVVLALAVIAVCTWVAVLSPGALEIVFLSVGQGDSSFIRTPAGRTMLVDAGGSLSVTGRDPGGDTVVPYLERRGVKRLDVVVATHPHQDHVGGLFEVLRRLETGVLLKPPVPEELRPDVDARLADAARDKGVPVVEVAQGGRVDFGDGVTIDILCPPRSGPGAGAQDLNDLSIVMMMRFVNTKVLLTGDAGPGVLSALVEDSWDLDADILKVPHHGASAACPPLFLRAVSPAWAVISVGPNGFGHPARDTLEVLSGGTVTTLRTDVNGAVTARVRGNELRVLPMRDMKR